MKNNTKVRLHLSKQLFESLAKQVLAEAKKGDMSGGAYTEAVKMPKEKKEKKAPEVKATGKMKEEGVEEMETKVAEAPTKTAALIPTMIKVNNPNTIAVIFQRLACICCNM